MGSTPRARAAGSSRSGVDAHWSGEVPGRLAASSAGRSYTWATGRGGVMPWPSASRSSMRRVAVPVTCRTPSGPETSMCTSARTS